MTRSRLTLIVYGDMFDVDEPSKIINIPPTESVHKGGKLKFRINIETFWQHSFKDIISLCAEGNLKPFEKIIAPRIEEIVSFMQKSDLKSTMRFKVGTDEEPVPAIVFENNTISLLGKLSSSIDSDLYIYDWYKSPINKMNASNYTTKFGILAFSQEVGDRYFQEASYQYKSDFYKKALQLPFSVFSKNGTIIPDTIASIEQTLIGADKLVAKALSCFQEQLLICLEGFHLPREEERLLNVPLQKVPLESLQFLFYDNKEWILYFARDNFSFYESCGISFHFRDKEPILVESLEDAEEIQLVFKLYDEIL